jgi:ATP-binding cassette, subfamily B, bacterial
LVSTGRPRTQAPLTLAFVWRVLRLVWSTDRRDAFLACVLLMLGACIPVGLLWASKGVVDEVAAGIDPPSEGSLHRVLGWIGLMALLALARELLQSLAEYVNDGLGRKVEAHATLSVLAKAASLDLAHFDTPQFYDQLEKATREVGFRPVVLYRETLRGMQSLASLLAQGALVISLFPAALAVVLLACIPELRFQLRGVTRKFGLMDMRTPVGRRLTYYQGLLTDGTLAKEIRAFNVAPWLLAHMRERLGVFLTEDRALAAQNARLGVGGRVFSRGAYYGAYAVLALEALGGRLSVGSLTLGVVALQNLQLHLSAVLSSLSSAFEHNLFLNRYFEFLQLRSTLEERAPRVTPPRDIQHEVHLRGVGFQYPGAEQPALRGIDLRLRPGEVVSIVGENGSGKTTLVKLLTRLYDPSEGAITVDGADLRQFDPDVYHSRVSVVWQDFARFDLSLRDNILLGNEARADQLEAALLAAGLDEVVARLPDGVNTMLGRAFDEGVQLSSGQWQRVAVARAFVRAAPLLILDEPSSALDARQEHDLFCRLRELGRGRTVVFITHRLSSTRVADRIIVLDKGCIVEQGDHDSLMRAEGPYARLFRLQASPYVDPAPPGALAQPGGRPLGGG